MTLAALLEELRDVDADAWHGLEDALSCLDEMQEDDNYAVDVLKTIAVEPKAKDLLQGCIQRACERPDHQWPFHVAYYPPEGPNAPYYQAYIWPALKCHTAQADTAAEALLSAYIAAVREEAK